MATSLTTCRLRLAVPIATNHALAIPHIHVLGGRNERKKTWPSSSWKPLKHDLRAADWDHDQLALCENQPNWNTGAETAHESHGCMMKD